MAQFDIHRASDSSLVVDIQSDVLSVLNTRIVVPLIPAASGLPAMRQLNPELIVDDTPYLLATQYLSAVRTMELGEIVGTLKPLDHRISLALDLLLHGI